MTTTAGDGRPLPPEKTRILETGLPRQLLRRRSHLWSPVAYLRRLRTTTTTTRCNTTIAAVAAAALRGTHGVAARRPMVGSTSLCPACRRVWVPPEEAEEPDNSADESRVQRKYDRIAQVRSHLRGRAKPRCQAYVGIASRKTTRCTLKSGCLTSARGDPKNDFSQSV